MSAQGGPGAVDSVVRFTERTVSRADFEALRRHGYAGVNHRGQAWVMRWEQNVGTVLLVGVKLVEEAA